MVRVLDVATLAAARDRSRVIPRNFLLVWAKPFDGGAEVPFGFSDMGEDYSVQIVNGENGAVETYTFYGDNAPIKTMDPIPLKIGLEIDTTQVVLNHLHPVVQLMTRGHNLRNARAQIHRSYLDPNSMLLVANPRCRRLGQVNTNPTRTAAAGAEGDTTLRIVSHTRELTRTNTAMRSDETQKLRSGDRFRRYSGVAGKIEIFWGEVKASQEGATGGKRSDNGSGGVLGKKKK